MQFIQSFFMLDLVIAHTPQTVKVTDLWSYVNVTLLML